MKVCFITSSMSRKNGGLFGAMTSLARHINTLDCDVQVFAGEDEFSGTDRAAWGDLSLSLFPVVGPRFFGFQRGLQNAVVKTHPDLAHFHGMWMYPSAVSRKLRTLQIPYLISPHGMLDPWAFNNSRWKKQLAGIFYENAHLRGAACIHALCESEYESIRENGLKNPVAIISNGVSIETPLLSPGKPEWATGFPSHCKTLLFLGRIHPKKGLVNLLHAWSACKKNGAAGAEKWRLVIAGWQEENHQTELEQLSRELTITDSVHFIGPQFNEEKEKTLSYADAFILPSLSEGVPMAILEAWAAALPVLMTPQCNLPRGFEAQAALPIDPNAESIAGGLKKLFALDETELALLGRRGYELVTDEFTWTKIAGQMISVYRWITGKAERPSYVELN